jgi:hypothetical protein
MIKAWYGFKCPFTRTNLTKRFGVIKTKMVLDEAAISPPEAKLTGKFYGKPVGHNDTFNLCSFSDGCPDDYPYLLPYILPPSMDRRDLRNEFYCFKDENT